MQAKSEFRFELKVVIPVLMLMFFLRNATAQAICDIPVDDFSEASINLEKTNNPEGMRTVINEKLLISQKLISNNEISTFSSSKRFRTDFDRRPNNPNGLPNSIEAMVAVTQADLTSTAKGSVFASIRGVFYNTLHDDNEYESRRDPHTNREDETGDIYAAVLIGDRGAGLEAWWEILQSTDKYFQSSSRLDTGTLIAPGTLTLNTEYLVKLFYDAADGFVFTVDGASATTTGPGKLTTDVDHGFRRLVAGAVPDLNTDSDPISVIASFDDVKVNGILYDDFSSGNLDQKKWEHTQAKRELSNGKLRTEVVAPPSLESGQRPLVRVQPNQSKYGAASCVQATVNLQSSSTIPPNTRGRLRIDGYWYNTTFSGANYDGYKGNVWAQITLEKTQFGAMQAIAYAEEVNEHDYSDLTELFFHRFITPINFDEDYLIEIKLDAENKNLIFRVADEVFVYPITTPINPAWPQEDYNSITTRLQSGPGTISALVDDVHVSIATPRAEDCDFFVINGKNGQVVTVCL